ncbi:MAG: choice-of-anchor tandem repeat NxxGxxAF-containing protein [Thermoanaerobaculia bacterium]
MAPARASRWIAGDFFPRAVEPTARRRTRRAGEVALAALLALAPGLAADQPIHTVVVYTDRSAPGTTGALFDTLFRPSIGALGDLAFTARLRSGDTNSGNQYGIWTWRSGTLALFARAGSASPVPSTTWNGQPSDPNVQDHPTDGHLGFKWRLLQGGNSTDALWAQQPGLGAMRLVARQGNPAPGIAGAAYGGLIAGTFNESLIFTRDLGALFQSTVTGGGVTTGNDQGLWRDDGTSATLLAREGDQPPGLGPGTAFQDFFGVFGSLLLNPSGVAAFIANANVSGQNRVGIWSTHGGPLGLRAIQGGTAPGLAGGEKLGLVNGLAINASGQIAFSGEIRNSFDSLIGQGIWISDATGALTLVYRVESGDSNLALGTNPILTDHGEYLFIGSYFAPPSTIVSGIFSVSANGTRKVALAGQRPPGAIAGITYSSFDQLTVNGHGQLAFRALLAGPGVTGANNRALYVEGNDRLFYLVARTGSQLEVTPGVFRNVSTVNLTYPSAGADGAPRGLGETADLVWLAGTGGISGAIVITGVGFPPDPTLVGLEVVQVSQSWLNLAPLVEGKTTFVRAHFQSTPSSNVTPRLRARVAGGGAELPFSPVAAANLGGLVAVPTNAVGARGVLEDNAFFEVPIEWTFGNVEFEVELLEDSIDCQESAGPTPLDCRVDAAFLPTGVPQVKFVAVDFDTAGGVRALGPGAEEDLARRMRSAMPIAGLDWRMGSLVWKDPSPPDPDTASVAKEMAAQRYLDKCRTDQGCKRIYYGALEGSQIDGYTTDFNGTEAAGYMPTTPTAIGRHTHTHEFGHIFGLEHAIDPAQGTAENMTHGVCGERAALTAPPYPYFFDVANQRRPTLGPMNSGDDAMVFGLDTLQRLVVKPTVYFEMMSYCAVAGIDEWPSIVTLTALHAAVNARFPPTFDAPEIPLGGPDLLLIRGTYDPTAVTATLDPALSLVDSAPFPAPGAGPLTLHVVRSGGGTTDTSFAPTVAGPRGDHPMLGFFLLPVDPSPPIVAIEIRSGATVLDSALASANPPSVHVVSPNGGENLAGATLPVSWTASDADLDPLTFSVQYSPDGGATWNTLATDWETTSFAARRELLAGSNDARIRVLASDGLRTAYDSSDAAFTVAQNAPRVAISSPAAGRLYFDGDVVTLEATAFDAEDGVLPGAAISWSSNVAGALGTGSPLSLPVVGLPDGLHVVTASVLDSANQAGSAQIQLRIDLPARIFEDDWESGGITLWGAHFP